jgi:UDP-3-O-[3-hydroxymyristoyl] glucosamine N-acyltransferase
MVATICPLDAPVVGGVSFTRLKSSTQVQRLLTGSPLAALLVPRELDRSAVASSVALVAVADPVFAMTQIVPLFHIPAEISPGINARADIDPSAVIGENVRIGAFCVVGPRARIEDGVVLHPHVVIYPGARIGPRSIVHAGAIIREDCTIGADSVIQNGAVIGADGFGYTPRPGIGLVSIPQVGTVVLADRVDVGANACIDRATLGETKVGLGTKIDNLVQVGHNTTIGQHSILCGQVGVAGSCSIGDQVVLGGAAGVGDHITIASGARFAGRSGVIRNITTRGDYAGQPATPIRKWNRAIAALLRSAPTREEEEEKN